MVVGGVVDNGQAQQRQQQQHRDAGEQGSDIADGLDSNGHRQIALSRLWAFYIGNVHGRGASHR